MAKKTVISVLGTAGRDLKSKEPVHVHYQCDILGKESGEFHNSTDVVLQHYEGEFYFIGTRFAIDFQKKLLDFSGKECHFIEVSDNSLDDIFEKIIELLSKHDDVVLDVTHGFRHQPIMAIFASTLSQFLERKSLQIIYAKVIDNQHYEYIYLNDYIDITQITMLLSGFIRTLNFIPIKDIQFLDHEIFENFSKALLSNDLRGVEGHYLQLSKELDSLKSNKALSHIGSLIKRLEDEISMLDDLKHIQKHERYLLLAKMTTRKNYLIVALTYIFESLRTYSDISFKAVTKDIRYKDQYERKQDIMNAITHAPFALDSNKIYNQDENFYNRHKERLKRVEVTYLKIRKLRNQLAHINETKDFDDIKKMVEDMVSEVEEIYRDDALKDIS